jgi:phosphoglycerol transferase MdoB-like AlkP superfamily enzyme
MQAFYLSSRRIIASLLIAMILFDAGFTALRALDTAAIIVVADAIVTCPLLAAVAARSTRHSGLDLLAFLIAALAISVSWGAAPVALGVLAHLPALVAAVAFATMALMLRTLAAMAGTEDSL